MSFSNWDNPKAALQYILERMQGALATGEAAAQVARDEVHRLEVEGVALKTKIAEFVKHIEGIL